MNRMLTRLTATLAATFAALFALAGSAAALPGEGYGIDPYGIPVSDGAAVADPVVRTATGMALSPFVFAAFIVATAAVVAVIGYRAGAIRQRRLALR